ncbi:hypothetical protein VTK56DRAFT_558 [Thermocarpiscus australiensis]
MIQAPSPSSIALVAIASLTAAAVYFVLQLNATRRFYRDNGLPKPPHDPIWGHLKLVGEYTKRIKGDYPQAVWTEIKQDFNLPDLYYLDLWPFGPEFIICAGPEAAALPTTVTAFPQADLVNDFFAPTVGRTFIEATNGPLWKELHQMLAPGLTPGATKTYHHLIVDEAKSLYDRLRRLAVSEEVADVGFQLGQYPFSIIWQVIFGEKPDANSGLYEDAKRLNDISGSTRAVYNPITRWQEKRERAAIARRLEKHIDKSIRSRFEKVKTQKPLPTRASANCLMDRMFLDQLHAGLPLDDRVMRLARENAKGFLVAGYGTTTDTTSYILMLLWSFPEALRKIREEHDRVFDKDFEKTLQLLREDPGRINDLHYTTAVIQETLRMFPIGMVVRQPPPGMTSLEYKGKTYPVGKNQIIGILGYSMHYDPEVFDEPKQFRPERFLTPDPTFPRSAYRPFERGLRSCLGQTLAMNEMKVALLMLARWFDLELRDHNPVAVPRLRHTDLDTVLGDHAFQCSRFTAGPNGDVIMKVRLASRSE